MDIKVGDILLDSIFLGNYGGSDITHDTKGIVVAITSSQVLVYWFDRDKNPWSAQSENPDIEWFDLNTDTDLATLQMMKNDYELKSDKLD